MTEEQVIELMSSCATREQWNAAADRVKRECRGYPHFWYSAIIESGLAMRVAANWGGDAEIRIRVI